ncbi:rCG25159 [Rattus norvegicus]|uniref:RCG25159 n=1 Tax=Rattus norvegicus TaxID=10116 RepID=A6I2D2_RAT|nr:rCG25159 [Rattus norvegicus]
MASKSSISVIEKMRIIKSNVSSEQLIKMRSSTQQQASNTRAETAGMLLCSGFSPRLASDDHCLPQVLDRGSGASRLTLASILSDSDLLTRPVGCLIP